MQKRSPLPKGTVLQQRYRIVRQLGRGGMGAVYEAEDVRLKNRLVALKETFADDAETRQAFEREAELLAATEHEAFPRVIDRFAEADGCFLVMELIRGEDLTEILAKRSEPFDSEQVLDWADQILDALEDLHAQGVVHRDIKPSNLKLTKRGRIKLLDFGIAKGGASEITAITTVGSLAGGTLSYAPLEQVLRADANFHAVLSVNFADRVDEILTSGTDARSDLYTLGITLYQLLTRRLPKNAPTRAAAVWSGRSDPYLAAHEINQSVPSEISQVLQKAAQLNPDQRFATAAEMRRMLREPRIDKTMIAPFQTENCKLETRAPKTRIEELDKPVFQANPVESDDDKIIVDVGGRIRETVFEPKFEVIKESKKIPLAVGATALILLGCAFGWRQFAAAPPAALSSVAQTNRTSGGKSVSENANSRIVSEAKSRIAGQIRQTSTDRNLATLQKSKSARTASVVARDESPPDSKDSPVVGAATRPRRAINKLTKNEKNAPDQFVKETVEPGVF